MTQDQEDALLNGGDCFKHWHSSDRQPTHDFLEGLQSIAKVVTRTSSYTADLSEDYVILDTTASIVNITLPMAKGNRVVTFLRNGGTNKVTLTPIPPETINATDHLDISAHYTPVRLLAVKGVGYIQV